MHHMTSSSITPARPAHGRQARRVDHRRRDPNCSTALLPAGAGETLSLAPGGGGWQLVNQSGRVVYRAEGVDAHRECLRRAFEHGVLYLR